MKTVILNGEKIKELLNLRKLTCAEISRKMGMNESYLSNIILRGGRIKESNFKFLCMMLEINGSDYLLKEKKPMKKTLFTDNEKNYVLLCSILKEIREIKEIILED